MFVLGGFMKKRICFLKDDIFGGGVERVTTIIANHLSVYDDEFSIYILDTVNKDKKNDYYINQNVHHYALSRVKRGKFGVPLMTLRLLWFLIRNKIDILITSQAMLGMYSVLATELTRTKHIIWEHANYYQKHTKIVDFLRQIELRICDYYVLLTKRDLSNFINNFNVKCPIEYIYNPIIKNRSDSMYNHESKTIISVGHLRSIKGFDMLIDVANIVFKKHGDWQWKIYGDGPEKERLKDKINEYGLDGNVILCGKTTEIENCYKSSSIYVLTSRMEGLPMVLLEAKTYNLPTVSFDIETGPNEIVRNNVNGFLIEPYNIELMADKICELIENNELRKKFSDNAKYDIDKFDIDTVITKWRKIIKEISS